MLKPLSCSSFSTLFLGSILAWTSPVHAQEVGPPPAPPATTEENEAPTKEDGADETAEDAPEETAATMGAPPPPPAEAEEAPAPKAPALELEEVTLILKNGQVLSGMAYVPDTVEDAIQIELAPGMGLTPIQRDVIAEIQKGFISLDDDVPYLGYQRYLYAPSAMPMKKGTGYLSQKELLFTAVGYAVTDNLSILGGTIVPLALWAVVEGEPEALLGVLAARYAREIKDMGNGAKLYAGFGFETFQFNQNDSGGLSLPFANLTYGKPESHVSLGIGTGLTDWERSFHPVVLAGTHRVHERLALISENWLIVTPETEYIQYWDSRDDDYERDTIRYWNQPEAQALITSFGVRFLSERVTTDLVLINAFVDGTYLPFPWLDLAWHFGH